MTADPLVTEPPAKSTDDCPECEAPVLNVQGLHACRDCGWVRGRA